MVADGDIVLVQFSMLQHYGKVIGISPAYRAATGKDEPSHLVKYINPNTGKIPKCPDSRCKSCCACCGGTFWADRLQRLTKPEIELFLGSGMLDQELVEDSQWPKTCSRGVAAPSAPVIPTRAPTKATKSSTAASSAKGSKRSSGRRRSD